MLEYLGVFFAVFFTDLFYTHYLLAVKQERAIAASVWAGILYVLGSIVVIGYTKDQWVLVPAIIGAVLGTYVGMKIKRPADS